MSLPSARIEEEGVERSVAPPRLRPGLLLLCSVTSFRRFSVSFPHKSRRFSLWTLWLCGFYELAFGSHCGGWVRAFCSSPRLCPGLLSLCSVTSFRRFFVSFPHKSRRFSLWTLWLCGFYELAFGSHCGGGVRAFCRSPETSSRVTLALLGNVFQTFPCLFPS